jgi:hypothetical protein
VWTGPKAHTSFMKQAFWAPHVNTSTLRLGQRTGHRTEEQGAGRTLNQERGKRTLGPPPSGISSGAIKQLRMTFEMTLLTS